ncbi:ATP-binding protein [Curtobacterium sp. VKM Ac-2865]|uniref:ATP-binding protein n=1 Tax=Curtobacterium sp. VKM Ac-2865 TaxID=2783817 RepID=UPI00188A682C|nr:ATP-binding protein [Curtobacterium sp. VKM Ac-2865]MBF4583130.1 ATP-binding protein [Curtobacterium sp. VKM Ac-2865]
MAINGSVLPTTGYVWPELDVDVDVDGGFTSPIMLVGAPGAMGKSEAARNIASALKAPYVNLAQLTVGTGSLVGELVKAFGASGAENLRDEVRAGRAILVLDSTDEAQLRSGSSNYFEFLPDLDWLINTDLKQPQVILLGRTDSISITEIALSVADKSFVSTRLAPLGRVAASQFMQSMLDRTHYSVHREQPEPFIRLCEAMLASLAAALLGAEVSRASLERHWSETDSFVGYPPVLKALSERLAVKNPQAELSKLEALPDLQERRQRGDILRGIVEDILDREASKVQASVGDSLALAPLDSLRKTLYGREEQAARLLHMSGVENVVLDRPAHLDHSDRSRYEELIEGFVADHPFIRDAAFANEVFSDYLRAWAISSPQSGIDTSDRPGFLASLPRVGPFFAIFLEALLPAGEPALIPEDLVDDAIRSNAIGSVRSRALYTHIEGKGARLQLFDEDEQVAAAEVVFEIEEPLGVLVLRAPLTRISIVSQYGVILRSGTNGQIDYGPDALIVASELQIDGSSFQILASNDASTFSGIIVRENVEHGKDLRVISHSSGGFMASWPNAWHQWKEYAPSSVPAAQAVPRSLGAQVVISVRKLLLSFHGSSVDAPAVSADKVDRVLIGGNGVAQTVRDVLVELGVIKRSGAQYYLDLQVLGERGLSWGALSSNDPYTALTPFCEKIINTETFISKHLKAD